MTLDELINHLQEIRKEIDCNPEVCVTSFQKQCIWDYYIEKEEVFFDSRDLQINIENLFK